MKLSYFSSFLLLLFVFLWHENAFSIQPRQQNTKSKNPINSNTKSRKKNNFKRKHPCLTPKNPLCSKIHILNPSLNLDFALKLSNVFLKVARKYKMPPNLLVAIAKQESNFRLDIVRMVRGLALDGGVYNDTESQVGSDFCMMQINASNISKLNFDANRLLNDLEYCIDASNAPSPIPYPNAPIEILPPSKIFIA